MKKILIVLMVLIIIGDILKEQRITVDAIAGATFSSLVIQDAVQKALWGFQVGE